MPSPETSYLKYTKNFYMSLNPLAEKQAFLESMTEDEFREKVVTRIFRYQGIESYRDLCGTDEDGKDAYFYQKGPFDSFVVHAVQTKATSITMGASDPTRSLLTCVSQLRTLLQTKIPFILNKSQVFPDYAYLISSRNISKGARDYICRELGAEAKLRFFDQTEIISMIDKHEPTFWYNLHPQKVPYLQTLKSQLLSMSDTISVGGATSEVNFVSPISEAGYVPLQVFRFNSEITVEKGKMNTLPRVEEIEDHKLLYRLAPLTVITGEGGTGKTTLLRRLIYMQCEQSLSTQHGVFIPVYIRARQWDQEGGDLLTTLQAEFSRIGQGDEGISVDDLLSGKVLVAIDSIDEVQSQDKQLQLLEKANSFSQQFPKIKILVAARETSEVLKFVAKNSVPHYRVSDFSIKQAEVIMDRIANNSPISAEESKEVLRRLHDVHGMRLNPLLVTAFATNATTKAGEIPKNIHDVFENYTNLMLGQWDQRKGIEHTFEVRVKSTALSHVARHLHIHRSTKLDLTEFTEMISEYLSNIAFEGDVDLFSDELLYRSGLLSVVGVEVQFRHLMLQEFFCGKGLSLSAIPPTMLGDEWWRNPIIFAFGSDATAVDKLHELGVNALDSVTSFQKFECLVTVGLSLQSLFLAPIDGRGKLFSWLLSELSTFLEDWFSSDSKANQFPLFRFLELFLKGRSAVGSDLVRKIVASEVPNSTLIPRSDTELFWRYVALFELGLMDEIEDEINSFNPKHKELLFGLFTMAMFWSALRYGTKDQKSVATRIANSLNPRVAPFFEMILEEYRGFVLEIQKGNVVALDAKPLDKQGQYLFEF